MAHNELDSLSPILESPIPSSPEGQDSQNVESAKVKQEEESYTSLPLQPERTVQVVCRLVGKIKTRVFVVDE